MPDVYWDVELTEPVRLKTGKTLRTMGDALETLRARSRSLQSPPIKTVVSSIRMATESREAMAREEATQQLTRLCKFNRWI